MSSMAKTAREAMKAKAQRLGSSRPLEKVDSSTFVPPELLDADVKTGLRPISRRAFKKGGKVMGEACEARADRKPRKSGGKAEATEYANAKINRNVKAANEEREGIKHVGALKTGGAAKRKHREDGGVAVKKIASGVSGLSPADAEKWAKQTKMDDYKNGPGFSLPAANPLDYNKEAQKRGGKVARKGRAKKQAGGSMPLPVPRPKNLDAEIEAREAAKQAKQANIMTSPEYRKELEERQNQMAPRKSGGRAKKNDGGPMSGAQEMMSRAQKTAGVPADLISSVPASSRFSHSMGLKKGGKVHEDVAADKALIKKMVKPEARKGKAIGGIMGEMFSPALMLANAIRGKKSGGRTGKADGGEMMVGAGSGKRTDKPENVSRPQYNEGAVDKAISSSRQKIGGREGAAIKALLKGRTGRKTGGGVFSGAGYPHKIPGVVPGGRTAHASGGKTKGKGKTNINIVIAAGKTPGADAGVLPPGGMPKPPGGIPIPLGAQGGPPQGGAPMPMPVPMPMPAPAGGPPGMPPMARKSGGRISKVASSYKDMTAGSGGGEGRLQKTDIAKKGKDAPAFKKGGKVYSSYKDMDAGAGSGKGRLEKTEIASRKH